MKITQASFRVKTREKKTMKENKFSSLNEAELMEINGGIDPVTIITGAAIFVAAGLIVPKSIESLVDGIKNSTNK